MPKSTTRCVRKKFASEMLNETDTRAITRGRQQLKMLIGIEDSGGIVQILRAINAGKEPHGIKLKGFPDMRRTVGKLVDLGLVDTLGVVPILKADHRPGTYFLTEKGLRWLRTHGRRERWLFALSRWQYLGGLLVGLVMGWIGSLTYPYAKATFCALVQALCELIITAQKLLIDAL